MKKLVLLRHGESEWNKLNLFTGWMDVDLSEKGTEEAKQAGQVLRNEGYDFDVCYTSYLKRAIHTLNITLDEMLMYGKEASNRKQEIDRQHYTIPNQRPKDKHCGKI